jgi:anthranilate phosphoribosyltransferase
MSALRDLLPALVARRDLEPHEMTGAIDEVLGGDAVESELAAFLIALRMKGETAAEVAACARALRGRALTVDHGLEGPVLDTCGTGGDGSSSFNVSTVTALVVAACGVPVAKHGNRAVSSRAGSADVLEALGVKIDLPPARVARSIRELGIGFLFAPAHHGALKHAAPVRRALGVRTIFNLMGPLLNPARTSHQLVGVYDRSRLELVAEVFGLLGSSRVWVVHGHGGLDEISPAGPTEVAEWRDGRVRTFSIEPRDFGLDEIPIDALEGGDASENAAIARDILEGRDERRASIVAMNAAAALLVAGTEPDLASAYTRAAEAIASGRAARLLDRWAEFTREDPR